MRTCKNILRMLRLEIQPRKSAFFPSNMYKYKWQNWLIVMIFNSIRKIKTIKTGSQERRIKKQNKKERCGICVGGGKKGKNKKRVSVKNRMFHQKENI